MEKQNDHKKFSKKIWVLSAGIIVILAIVLFAGIKNGFFLRKDFICSISYDQGSAGNRRCFKG